MFGLAIVLECCAFGVYKYACFSTSVQQSIGHNNQPLTHVSLRTMQDFAMQCDIQLHKKMGSLPVSCLALVNTNSGKQVWGGSFLLPIISILDANVCCLPNDSNIVVTTLT
jgi:hypothetical protein